MVDCGVAVDCEVLTDEAVEEAGTGTEDKVTVFVGREVIHFGGVSPGSCLMCVTVGVIVIVCCWWCGWCCCWEGVDG